MKYLVMHVSIKCEKVLKNMCSIKLQLWCIGFEDVFFCNLHLMLDVPYDISHNIIMYDIIQRYPNINMLGCSFILSAYL